ncbi:MAG TPA: hypothetical protein VIT66_06045, partial [Lysobacter sp.]
MATRETETNRFHGLSLGALYEACQTRASTLLGLDKGRSTQERANLAKDTAHLLLAVAPTLASGEHVPGTPSQAILQGSEDFLPAFLTSHEIELRQVRYRTLVAASDLAYGGDAEQWRRDATIDGQRVYGLAMGSEEGLAL